MEYALIRNSVVVNLIWLHPENADDFPSAVPYGDVPVAVGDIYDGGCFWRNGERVLTYAEQAAQEMASMRDALAMLGVNADD